MADLTFTQGDTRPPIFETLTAGGRPLNLTAATGVEFVASRADSRTWGGNCSIVNAAAGQVRYTPQPGDTDHPGIYLTSFVVEWGVGNLQTIPGNRIATVEIRSSLRYNLTAP